jgi:hypothetical protein
VHSTDIIKNYYKFKYYSKPKHAISANLKDFLEETYARQNATGLRDKRVDWGEMSRR